MSMSSLGRIRPHLTITAKLVIMYVLLVAIVLAALSFFLYQELASGLFADQRAILAAQAAQVADSNEWRPNSLQLPDPTTLPPGAFFQVCNLKGDCVDGRFPPGLDDSSLPKKTTAAPVVITGSDDEMWLATVVPVRDERVTVGYLRVERSMEPVYAALHRLLALILIAVPLALAVAALGGYAVARAGLAPIGRIIRTAQAIGEGDLSQRIGPLPGHDEVGRLASTFDDMLGRLEQAFARQKQFTADASHELRTPVAAIRAQAEAALAKPRSREEYVEILSIIREEAQHLGHLVAQLMFLARQDAAPAPSAMETVNLDEILDAVVQQMRVLADQHRISLTLGANPAVLLRGDQTALTQLFINLVDNAVKYTPAGGQVTVASRPDRTQVHVSITDTGPGIPPEHLPRIFDRFYRVDKARSRSMGGAGLGLAIAMAVARAHGGDITVETKPGQGSVFTVTLPRYHASPNPNA